MSILQTEVRYRVERDVDGRRNRHHNRAFQAALRWYPELADESGARILRRLDEGDAVSVAELSVAVDYLVAAIQFYRSVSEPVPGRNADAIRDLEALMELLA